MAYILAIAVGLSSFALYMAAFFFPELHRKYDLIWSGIGLFYALVLWVCAGRITGGVLLGQTASVALLGWFGWQTLLLRRELTPKRQRTLAGSNQTVLQVVQANLKTMQHNLQAQWRSVMPFPAGSRPIAGSPAGATVGSTPSSAPASSPDTARPAGKKSRPARSGRSPRPERTSAPATPNPTGTAAASTPASLNSIANSGAPTVELAAAETPSPETHLPPTAPEQPDSALASNTQAPEAAESAASNPKPDADLVESDASTSPASDAPTDEAIAEPAVEPASELATELPAESSAEPAAELSGEPLTDDRRNWADPFGDEDEILDAEFEEIGKPLSAQEQAVLARRTANDKRASRKTNLFGGLVSRIQSTFSKQRPSQTSPLPPAEATGEPNPAIADRGVDDDDTWPADEESTPALEPAAPASPGLSALEHDQPETPQVDAEDSNWDLDDSGDRDEPGLSPEFAAERAADAVAEPEPGISPEPNPDEAIALDPQAGEPELNEPETSEPELNEREASEPELNEPETSANSEADEDSNWDLDEIFADDAPAETAIAHDAPRSDDLQTPASANNSDNRDDDLDADLANLDIDEIFADDEPDVVAAIVTDDPNPAESWTDESSADQSSVPEPSSHQLAAHEPSALDAIATEVEALPPEDTDWDVDEIFADEAPLSDDHAIAPETIEVAAEDVSEGVSDDTSDNWAEPSEWLDRPQDSALVTEDEQSSASEPALPSPPPSDDEPSTHHYDPAAQPPTPKPDLTGVRRTYSSEPHFNDDDEDWF